MKHDQLVRAGDSCEALVVSLRDAQYHDLANEAQALLKRIRSAEDEAFDASQAEPELEMHS